VAKDDLSIQVGSENVAQSILTDEQSADTALGDARVGRGRQRYLGAICAAVAFGSVLGLMVATLLPASFNGDVRTSLVSVVEASTSGALVDFSPRSDRAAPRLLYPENAEALGADNPFLGESPVRDPAQTFASRPKPMIDLLDLPIADDVTLLAAAVPVIENASIPLQADELRLPRIAIVLDDLGLDEKSTRRAIALPRSITLSFLPYGRSSVGLAEEGLARGHEILVHIPMEPEGTADPGPNALLVGLPADEISMRLASQLDKFPGAIGFNNHMGSRFTADVRALLPVMREARARGLLFLDSRTTVNTFAAKVAEAAGATTVSRDIFLDYASGADGLLAQFDELEKTARMTGSAIAIGHPHELTFDVLETWVRGLDAKGIELVSISAMAEPDARVEPDLLAASGL